MLEGKSRGLSCGVTEGVREWTCSKGFKICKNDFLCQIVTHVQNGNLSRQNGSIIKKYVTEAKRRGLSCDVIGSENTTIASSTSSFTNTTTPKNAFRGDSVMKRKQIQYALKNLIITTALLMHYTVGELKEPYLALSMPRG